MIKIIKYKLDTYTQCTNYVFKRDNEYYPYQYLKNVERDLCCDILYKLEGKSLEIFKEYEKNENNKYTKKKC